MRARRFLLVTSALSTIAAAAACGKESGERLHGNPKGLSYEPTDAARPVVPDVVDAAPPPAIETPEPPKNIPPPGNPKGSRYDAGKH